MATIRTTDDRDSRELAISAKEHDKLERENKLMKMLMELHPTIKPMERYYFPNNGTGWYQDLWVTVQQRSDGVITARFVQYASDHTTVFGTEECLPYPDAKAWLAERLKGNQ